MRTSHPFPGRTVLVARKVQRLRQSLASTHRETDVVGPHLTRYKRCVRPATVPPDRRRSTGPWAAGLGLTCTHGTHPGYNAFSPAGWPAETIPINPRGATVFPSVRTADKMDGDDPRPHHIPNIHRHPTFGVSSPYTMVYPLLYKGFYKTFSPPLGPARRHPVPAPRISPLSTIVSYLYKGFYIRFRGSEGW